MSSKTRVTSPKIAVNKGRLVLVQLEHLRYMSCCFIVWEHMAKHDGVEPLFILGKKFTPLFLYRALLEAFLK